jgi:hypothetical protein
MGGQRVIIEFRSPFRRAEPRTSGDALFEPPVTLQPKPPTRQQLALRWFLAAALVLVLFLWFLHGIGVVGSSTPDYLDGLSPAARSALAVPGPAVTPSQAAPTAISAEPTTIPPATSAPAPSPTTPAAFRPPPSPAGTMLATETPLGTCKRLQTEDPAAYARLLDGGDVGSGSMHGWGRTWDPDSDPSRWAPDWVRECQTPVPGSSKPGYGSVDMIPAAPSKGVLESASDVVAAFFAWLTKILRGA